MQPMPKALRGRFICALSIALSLLAPYAVAAEANIIYLTRHAEKAATGTDPALTAQGVTRAQNIAAMLKKTGINNIYSTNYVRTQQTAQPLATLLALPVQTYDPAQLPGFAAQLKLLSGNTLVVGHSDTTPELIRQLGGDPGPAIAETEFDRLYQVIIGSDGQVTTEWLTSLPSVTATACNKVSLNRTALAGAVGSWTYFTIDVPECANTLSVTMSGGTGDGDLFLRHGAPPTASTYYCRPYKTGNAESCPASNPQAGVWHIGINAYKAFTGITLDVVASE